MRFRIFGKVLYMNKKAWAVLLGTAVLLAAIIGHALMQRDANMPPVQAEDGYAAATGGSSGRVDATRAPDQTPERTPNQTPEPARIAVHISGCVLQEGVYWVEQGSIVNDVVLLAGGLTEQADVRTVNLAMRVNDGMHIHIPDRDSPDKTWLLSGGVSASSGSPGVPASPGSPAPDDGGGTDGQLVNINTATLQELMTLPGVGESTAQDILRYRAQNGLFSTIEEIMEVPGIKEMKFAKFKDFITV